MACKNRKKNKVNYNKVILYFLMDGIGIWGEAKQKEKKLNQL